MRSTSSPLRRWRLLLIWLTLLSAGCAGVGVMASSDPLVKLNDADYLFTRQNRPLIAERLIMEAMTIYQQQDDARGLGHANRAYADLLLSASVSGKWSTHYRQHGFEDRTVTYENRTAKAAEYYTRALGHYARAADRLRGTVHYDELTNVYFNMAYSYLQLNDHIKACHFYDETLAAYQENIRRNPNAKPFSPTATVADIVDKQKEQANCT
jgi:tetratricopeptide (TPR) repeat protein